MYTPPVLSDAGGPLATLQVPADHGGANWPGGSLDPETNRLYIHSHTAVFAVGIVPADSDRRTWVSCQGLPVRAVRRHRLPAKAPRRRPRLLAVATAAALAVAEAAAALPDQLAAAAAAGRSRPCRGCRSSSRPTTGLPPTT